MRDFDPSQYGEADRREVDPPIQVEAATWSAEFDQVQEARDAQDPGPRSQAPHGTTARWNEGCACAVCRRTHNDKARVRKRARAQVRLPVEARQKLLAAIHDGRPFRAILRDLGLTSNQVWGLTKTDQEWSERLDAALTATRRDHLKHGTNAAYVQGCVSSECRAHQRVRMARNRGGTDPHVEPRNPTSGYQWEVEPADVLSDRSH
jgi:hypothetical protein